MDNPRQFRAVSFREILAALDVLSIASDSEMRGACECADGMDTRRGHIVGTLSALSAYAGQTERLQECQDKANRAAESR